MCDPGYYGASCEMKDYAHYVFDHLRFTWSPYVLSPIIGIAWIVIGTWIVIPRHTVDLDDFLDRLFDNLDNLDIIANEYKIVSQAFWPSYVVNTFATVLGFAFCYKQWKQLLVATCF